MNTPPVKKLALAIGAALALQGVSIAAALAMDPSLTWYGQSAFKYTTRTGKVILIDPWMTNPKAPKDVKFQHVEGILVTHGHADHVGEAFELATKYNAPLVASPELTVIAQQKGVKQVMPLNPGGNIQIGDVTVTAVEAVHSSGYKDGETPVYAGAPLGFVLAEYGQPTIYHAGDTDVFEDMGAVIARLYQPQIALLPIGGNYTMGPTGAALAVQWLQVRDVVPMHYGTFPVLTGTPEKLKQEMKRLGANAQVRDLPIGKEVKIKDLL